MDQQRIDVGNRMIDAVTALVDNDNPSRIDQLVRDFEAAMMDFAPVYGDPSKPITGPIGRFNTDPPPEETP